MEDASVLVIKREDSIDLPPGFRFHPTDEEIITHYLLEKVLNSSFSATAVGEVDLNKCEPWELPNKAKMGEKEWYFFCQRDRKYPSGMRTNRATEAGYWKATGKDKEIYTGKGCLVGMKKTLVFYRGRAPKGEKTNWVMNEYRLEGKFCRHSLPNTAKEAWVVSKVFHKRSSTIKVLDNSSPVLISGTLSRINSCDDDHQDVLLENYSDPNSAQLPPDLLMDPRPPPQYCINNSNGGPCSASSFMRSSKDDDDQFQRTIRSSSSRNTSDGRNASYLATCVNDNDHHHQHKLHDHKNFLCLPKTHSQVIPCNAAANPTLSPQIDVLINPFICNFRGTPDYLPQKTSDNVIPVLPSSELNTVPEQAISSRSVALVDNKNMLFSVLQDTVWGSSSTTTATNTGISSSNSAVSNKHNMMIGKSNTTTRSSYEDEVDHEEPASSSAPVPLDLEFLWNY